MEPSNIATRYDASSTEQKWYSRWEEAGLFKPSPDKNLPVYCITIPPPNITGSLHMGHALCYPLQDLLGRYQRMQGKSVLILPGQDHAGIATQSVVDRQLKKQGTSASQIGREKFVEKVWEWRKESGDTIFLQLRALGCAFDWSRQRFTLDDRYAEAVLKVFIDWYRRGFIFRGMRVVNWDPKLQTSVSDIETVRETRRGKLYHIRYPYSDGSGEVVIATTRPETMLADVAVAVHPSDQRYTAKIGKTLILPLVNREIPIIADPYADPEFGTGAVKITPAHDANDYQVGVRHGLDMPVILDPQARISLPGPYFGLDRNEARKQIIYDLESGGYLVKIEDHDIPIVISDRSGEVIEPLLSEQWFCDQPKLAEPVIKAIEAGEIKFHPERYQRIFHEWMLNIREWCISRQLWWGHRIPIYYDEADSPYAAMSWEDAQRQAGDNRIVRQDDDVLDTWFSSGLWPFATLGWPDETEDMARFYPTSCLVTDRNIINLWVARMTMMGYDLAGAKPFSDVMIFATVMREDGRRMSKSLGTGVDPMEIIRGLGADVMRYTLLSQTGENQELRYSEKRTEDARNFCNKIWNATRFILMNAQGPAEGLTDLSTVDKWILSRLYQTEKTVRAAYDGYDIQSVCQAMYRFFWSELCDWYIEISKPRLSDPLRRLTPQTILLTAIDAFLKMMHPVMPFLTEELYSYLPDPKKAPFLMSAPWPKIPESFYDPAAEREIERVFEITRAVRALRVGLDLQSMKTVPVAYIEGDLQGNEDVLASQAWIQELRPGRPEGEPFLSTTCEGVDVHIPTASLVDAEKELARLAKEEEKLVADLTRLQARLGNPQFVERAKPEIVERERELEAELKSKLEKLADRRKLFA